MCCVNTGLTFIKTTKLGSVLMGVSVLGCEDEISHKSACHSESLQCAVASFTLITNGEVEAHSHMAGDPRVSAPCRARPSLTVNTSKSEPARAVRVPGAGALLQPHPWTKPRVSLKPQMLTLWNGISESAAHKTKMSVYCSYVPDMSQQFYTCSPILVQVGRYWYSHFTDEETEAQEIK